MNNDTEKNENNEEHYDLYTEHIVKDPWDNIKRWIKRGLMLLGMAAVFGLIAGLIMIIVFQVGSKVVVNDPVPTTVAPHPTVQPTTPPTPSETEPTTETESDESTREDITLDVEDPTTDESSEETTSAQEDTTAETVDEALLNLQANYQLLKKLTAKVNRSMVTVTVATESTDWFSSTYQNITEEFGLVIANNEAGCYLVTDYELVRKNITNISVTYANGVVKPATLLSGDVTTGLAVLLTETVTEDEAVVASLVGSGSISQGDFVLAVGKIYGFAGSMGYGIATSVGNYVNDTDSSYQLINTDISGAENSAGVLANLNGEIVGLITTSYSSGNSYLITAYAMSGVKSLIENLSNSHLTAYFGIRGQDITPAIKEENKLPDGIYIAAVESNSPAYKAGLQSGDVLIGINGEEVLTMSQFMEVLANHSYGDTLTVTIQRKGRESYKEIELSVVLGVE